LSNLSESQLQGSLASWQWDKDKWFGVFHIHSFSPKVPEVIGRLFVLLPVKWDVACGEFHDQADAKWIVIRGQLRGHNDMPFGWPTPGGRPQGVFGGFSYYL
jgi:hypothetical protein